MKRRILHIACSVAVGAVFVLIVRRSLTSYHGTLEDLPRPISIGNAGDSDRDDPEMDAPQEFDRYYQEIRTREDQIAPEYPLNYRMTEVQRAVSRRIGSLEKAAALPWIERGPGNVGGRTRGLIVDPDDAAKNTWFAGSVGGGIWKTTDAGASWVNKTPGLPNLATVTLMMAPSNHNVIYAGTGEGFGNTDAVRGDGIWKSLDRGETWIQLSATASNSDFSFVNRIIVDPANENIVLAATNTGIFRSTNGGATWNTVYSSSSKIQQIVANPANFNTLYATKNANGVLKSTDRGLTWSPSSMGLGTGARSELAISPVDTARLFLAIETSSSTSDLYASDNAGASWAKAIQQSGTPPNWLNGQGWYDNAIAAHPYDRDICFVGGLDLYKIQIVGGVTQSSGILGVAQYNSSSFLGFVNWGGPFMGGGVGTGKDFYGTTSAPISLAAGDYVSVEIRFGPGISQKAHRFSAGWGFLYPYLGYITVPFQVWDVTNNRQLMVSFRDSDSTGTFHLLPYDSNNPQREYIFVHAVPYDAAKPDSSIAILGGERFKNIYAVWPMLTGSAPWNENNLPASNVRINYGAISSVARTTTRMTNWVANQTLPYVHADHHNITIIPVSQSTQSFRILDGSDGGIGISNNGGVSWSNPNLGYNTSQFYGLDKKPGSSQYIGGTQDNGTFLSTSDPTAPSSWKTVIGGDGFASIWNYKDGSKLIGSLYYNQLYRSTDGGNTFQSATTDLTDVGSGLGPFITQIAKSNSDPDLLFVVGSSGVWRSDNFAQNWTQCRIAPNDWTFGTGANVAISIADPEIVWAGTHMSNGSSLGKIHVSTDGGVTFNPTGSYSLATLGRLSGFATHPVDPKTAYALFSFSKTPKILRTTDLGQTWQDISGFTGSTTSTRGFPDVATYCLLVIPYNPSEIWVGTEIGLFISKDYGASWTYANDIIPAVAIWQLRVVDDEIIAATHGRGIWTVKIPALLTAPPPVVTLSPRLDKPAQGPDGAVTFNIGLRSAYDSSSVFLKGSKLLSLAANAAPKDTLIRYQVVKADSLTMNIVSYSRGKSYSSPVRGINARMPYAPQTSYVDNFDVTNSNFTSNGFTLSTPTGFSNQAYHTPHPYADNREYTLLLNVPIIVQSANPAVRFDEIAIVEPGEPGSVYGSASFYDYCVVEATRDGSNWIALEDGYNARRDSTWLAVWNAHGNGTPADLRKHQMSLAGKFSAGDVVFIRFRMHTDGGTNGWGWMIDNLEIQNRVVSVIQNGSALPKVFALAQNYPNPFNPTTTIRFDIPVESRVTLSVFDALGRKVQTLVEGHVQPGVYLQSWNAGRLASGVYFYRLDASESVSNRHYNETRRLVVLK